MQTGGPSPAPVQRAPRSPTRAGRDDAQAARERSVWAAPDENRPRSASRSTLAKASFVERDFGWGLYTWLTEKAGLVSPQSHLGVVACGDSIRGLDPWP
jgi:hypothetical protein